MTVTVPSDATAMLPCWNRWVVTVPETTAAATGNPSVPAGPPFDAYAAWIAGGTVWIPVPPAM
ncbi:hypothetical protein D3C74_471050 [compost metagenome]